MNQMVNVEQTATSRNALLQTLLSIFSDRELGGVKSIAEKVVVQNPYGNDLSKLSLMVAYGGGKDSSYTVAFMRAVQLYILQQKGETFKLRVANMRHAGVPYAVMKNIDRVYAKLGLLNDSLVELITIDNHDVIPFHVDAPMPSAMVENNRLDILMNGHRTQGDGRPTFCNSCNLSVSNFYGIACWWNGGVDFVVTGDSKKEQKHYFTWIMRLGQKLGIDTSDYQKQGFKGALELLSKVGDAFYQDLYGESLADDLAARHVSPGGQLRVPEFLSIYEEVSYRVDEHWKLVVDFLGFEFDDLAFSFTESDCFNPAFMAHLRALKVQHVQGRSYHEGMLEYLSLAERLMRKKEIPQKLIDLAMSRYESEIKIAEMHQKVAEYVEQTFDLTEEQLICLVYSPFVSSGQRLLSYLNGYQPQLVDKAEEIREVLSGQNQDAEVALELERISGLQIAYLQRLYASEEVDFGSDAPFISYIRKNDPHKGLIETVDVTTGDTVQELVSGR